MIRPRIDQSPIPDYDPQRTVIDRSSTVYVGDNQTSEYQRPYTTQPNNSQPYNAQPYNDQPYNAQPYNGQPYNAQPNNGLPYNGQANNGQPYNAQPYTGRQAFNNNTQPSYPDVMPNQSQQPFNQAYGQQQYDSSPRENQYYATQEPQAPTQPEAYAQERYCPECDAELPYGASECPVCHTKIEIETIVEVEGVCADCGTEVSPGQKYCHECGAPLKVKGNNAVASQPVQQPEPSARQPQPAVRQPEPAQDVYGCREEKHAMTETDTAVSYEAEEKDDTVAAGPLASKMPECELKMIDTSGEILSIISCVGDEVELYRGNTDPANNTISRDMQARLTFSDGKWSIEDCSALRTTFIRPSRKMELQDGDVIVMGNREFIFKS